MKTFATIILLMVGNHVFCQQIMTEHMYSFLPGKTIAQGIDTTESGGYIFSISQNYPNYTFPGIYFKTNFILDTIWTFKNENLRSVWDNQPCKTIGNQYYVASIFAKKVNDTIWGSIQKIDKYGNRKFIQDYLPSGRNSFYKTTTILPVSSNDLIVFGVSVNSKITLGQGGGDQYTIVRIDSSGNQSLIKVFFSSIYGNIGAIGNIAKYGSSNFVMYGFGGPTMYHTPFLYKADNNLDSIKTNTLYVSQGITDEYDPEGGNLIYTKSNNFFMCGMFRGGSSLQYKRNFIMKSDTNLNLIWKMRLPQSGNTYCRLFELENDTLLLVSTGLATNQILLYKILQDSTIVSTTILTSTIG
ncbi:MAG: hypothetical protein K2Q22_08315, partial [Cytophagales bacterium]|nr:hypothetical protein [Cytophagales bacterium]